MKTDWRIVTASLVFAMVVPWLTGCRENSLLDRSLLFATHTTMGLEIAVSANEIDSPVKILIGYKRSEMVLNPVYHSEGVVSPAMKETPKMMGEGGAATLVITSEPVSKHPVKIKRYRKNAYSVLAKIATKTVGLAGNQASADLALSQWFATGEAAIILAQHPETARALSGSSSPGRNLESQLSPTGGIYNDVVVSAIYEVLKDLADKGDLAAAGHVAALDALGRVVPETHMQYSYDATGDPLPILSQKMIDPDRLRPEGETNYDGYKAYVGLVDLGASAIKSSLALEDTAFTFTLLDESIRTVSDSDDDENRVFLRSQLQALKSLLAGVVQEDKRDAAATAAVTYYAELRSN